ncbi:uncharacterized protein [Miscanthus floridulus]|uniref:uncharacterized protein n=1 Tax=Miscanthus floridulus TaxID=154761 RepID=UPI003458F207
MVAPTIGKVKLNRVLIDGGAGLNIIFARTLDDMKIPRSRIKSSVAPFHDIVPRKPAIPLRNIELLVTFITRDKYPTETVNFGVADFETAYHAISGRPFMAKFMAVPHYIYQVMKIPAHNGIISVRGDVQQAYTYEQEHIQLVEALEVSLEAADVNQAAKHHKDLGEVPSKNLGLAQPDCPTKRVVLDQDKPSKTAVISAELDPK